VIDMTPELKDAWILAAGTGNIVLPDAVYEIKGSEPIGAMPQ
jgi:hypothetical protein